MNITFDYIHDQYFNGRKSAFDEALHRLRRLWTEDYERSEANARTLANVLRNYDESSNVYKKCKRDMEAQNRVIMDGLVKDAKEAITADLFHAAVAVMSSPCDSDIVCGHLIDDLQDLDNCIYENWPYSYRDYDMSSYWVTPEEYLQKHGENSPADVPIRSYYVESKIYQNIMKVRKHLEEVK